MILIYKQWNYLNMFWNYFNMCEMKANPTRKLYSVCNSALFILNESTDTSGFH